MGAHTIRQAADTRAVLDAVRQIVRVLHESSRAAEMRVGVTGAQLFVLQKLAESPASSLNDLAGRTHTHQSSVSTVVSRLVRRGLVMRTPAATDKRRLELRLSPEGRRLVARAPDAAQSRLVAAIEQMPAVRRRSLAQSLGALTTTMDVAGRQPVMFFDEAARPARKASRG